MADFKTKFLKYIRRMGADSVLISIIVHFFIIGGATVWVVNSVQPQRKAAFKGAETGQATGHPAGQTRRPPRA